MCGAIKEFGFRIPIVAKSDGTVVDGHLRLKAASASDWRTSPLRALMT
jgi:ParB-like chromosome segregation protein Spo0J